MPISYPLTLPTNKAPTRISLIAATSVAVSTSPFSYASQVQQFSGQAWRAEITLPLMERADAEEWTSFLLKLNGPEGTFLLGDYTAKTPRGSAPGTPLVKGAGQTGQELLTDGWGANQTNVLRQGDYFQIGQRLYKVLEDESSNGSGEATLTFWPALRSSPADNAALIVSNCVGLFRLTNNAYQVHSADIAKHFSISFSAEEAI